jgi:hypothetical protein
MSESHHTSIEHPHSILDTPPRSKSVSEMWYDYVSDCQQRNHLGEHNRTDTPIGSVSYLQVHIGPILGIPSGSFHGRDHLFTMRRVCWTHNTASENSPFHYRHNSRGTWPPNTPFTFLPLLGRLSRFWFILPKISKVRVVCEGIDMTDLPKRRKVKKTWFFPTCYEKTKNSQKTLSPPPVFPCRVFPPKYKTSLYRNYERDWYSVRTMCVHAIGFSQWGDSIYCNKWKW